MIEDAQLQYDELEASFFQVLKGCRSFRGIEKYHSNPFQLEKNLSWFGQLGGTSPNDDSAPLLSATKKPYRDLILSNTITIFDFRSYLLARQCTLLARRGHITEAATKAARFVTTFARTLQENEASLSKFFVESWMYSAAFNIVDQCQLWTEAALLDPSEITAFDAVQGELLELARTQLDKIGITAGHLPSTPPFTIGLPSAVVNPNTVHVEPVTPSTRGPPISRPDLLAAISSRDEFDKLYFATTHRAIKTYTSAGRGRFALKLHASLGALELSVYTLFLYIEF